MFTGKQELIITVSILIVILISVIIINKKYDNLVKNNSMLRIDIVKLNEKNKILKTDKQKCDNELETLRNHLEGIKDEDDLLKRDIQLFAKAINPKLPKVVTKAIAENVVSMSNQYEIPAELVIGIIHVESTFNPLAVSNKNARGLMQVMPEWAKKFDINIDDLHDIDIGIESGIKVFLIHLDENKGKISKALYYYVGKDQSYVDRVYASIGRFVSFRSTIDNSKKIKKEEDFNNATDNPTENSH